MAGSLASATNTRVDSASKHIIPCKVNTDYMASLVGGDVDNNMRELQTNKMRYCMHKDDVVIGLGRPMFGSSINNSRKKAYPSVIVTLASMEEVARRWIALHNFLVRGYDDANTLRDMFMAELRAGGAAPAVVGAPAPGLGVSGAAARKAEFQINNLLDFYFVGVSLGLAYAHPHSGDTVASVMVGGLRTVLNGHFQVHTNDLLMFYWGDELDLFEPNGSRRDRQVLCTAGTNDPDVAKVRAWVKDSTLAGKQYGGGALADARASERRDFYGMRNGVYKNGPDGKHGGKDNVAMIKPYIVSMHADPADPARVQHFPMDKCRVFGKAISNAQPFEMLDIMLSRQSI